MPSLRDFLSLVVDLAQSHGETFSDDFAVVIENQVRSRWPGERIYVVPSGSRKEPSRAEAIAEASRRLPPKIVAERFGVTRNYVNKVNLRTTRTP